LLSLIVAKIRSSEGLCFFFRFYKVRWVAENKQRVVFLKLIWQEFGKDLSENLENQLII